LTKKLKWFFSVEKVETLCYKIYKKPTCCGQTPQRKQATYMFLNKVNERKNKL